MAELFNVEDPARIAFTKNSTEALNIAIFGLLSQGDHAMPGKTGHAITSSMEHNSVMRPLRFLEAQGIIDLTVLPCSPTDGSLDPDAVRRALRPNTRLITVLHASNVIGNLLPVREIGAIAREAGVPFLVDASQTAGAYPLDVEALNIDLLAFTGHKSMLGPTGTGGLYVREGCDPRPLFAAAPAAARSWRCSPTSCPTSTRPAR